MEKDSLSIEVQYSNPALKIEIRHFGKSSKNLDNERQLFLICFRLPRKTKTNTILLIGIG